MAIHRAAIFAIIVVGAAALVTRTYFQGEPGTEPPTPTPAAVVVEASPPPPGSAPATGPSAPVQRPARSLAAEARRTTALHATEALAAYRSTFVERCWTPSAGPDHIDLRFNLAFDPNGTLVGYGISQSRKAFRADVSACLRGLSVKLTVPPPGTPVQVQVPLTLP